MYSERTLQCYGEIGKIGWKYLNDVIFGKSFEAKLREIRKKQSLKMLEKQRMQKWRERMTKMKGDATKKAKMLSMGSSTKMKLRSQSMLPAADSLAKALGSTAPLPSLDSISMSSKSDSRPTGSVESAARVRAERSEYKKQLLLEMEDITGKQYSKKSKKKAH